jgi:hypothetical protein
MFPAKPQSMVVKRVETMDDTVSVSVFTLAISSLPVITFICSETAPKAG